MAVVGVHEILLKPTLSGGQRAIGKELDGMADKTGQQAGRTMGGALGKALKVGAVAVGGAAVTGIGVALTKGFGRLRAIEQAQATLTGLGHSAQTVEQIMQNTNAAVKGTAFGLGEAATVAAQMVASGIKPGQELQDTLTLVGDAATIAGVGINDMGAIFAKAAASNKVQMDIINQLHDAGVPALQLIATEMGVTAEEASKMASAGEVDFATFQRAMEQGMGGAAQESGKTLSGAFDNSMAAIGRFGANLMQDVYPQLTTFFNGFIEWMGPVEQLGAVIGEKLGQAMSTFADSVGRAAKAMADNILPIGIFAGSLGLAGAASWVAAGGIGTMTTAIGLFFIALNTGIKSIPVIGWIITAVGALVSALVWFFTETETGQQIVQNAWAAIQTAVAAVVDWFQNVLVPAFQAVWDGITSGVEAILGWFTGTAGPAFQGVWDAIGAGLAWVNESIIQPVFTAISNAWSWMVEVVRAVYEATLKPVFDAVGAVVSGLWNNVLQPVFHVISQFWILAIDLIKFAWENVGLPVFQAVGQFISDLWTNTISVVFGFIGTAWGGLVNGIRDFWNGVLLPVFQAVGNFLIFLWENYISPVFSWIGDRWGGLVNGIRDLWSGVLRPVFQALGDFISDIWTGYIQPVFTWIGDAWGGMINGIKDLWENNLKPVLQAFGDFVHITIVQRIEDAVSLIKSAWSGLANGLRAPIQWVLTHVWNNGIVKAFNSVADAIDSKAELEPAGDLPRFAKGGRHKGGWALVGEEGPELVNFSQPGRVYTAAQTAAALAQGRDLSPEQSRRAAGRSQDEAVAPMGDGFNWGAAGDELKKRLGLGRILGTDQMAAGTQWIVGNLAKAARSVMDAAMSNWSMGGQIGQVTKDVASKAVGMVVDWATKQDEATMDGSSGAVYDGKAGPIRRPSSGGITSWYGRRWGRHHAGIDFAGGGVTRAAMDGVVQRVGWNLGPGRTGYGILMNHGPATWTYHGHNPVNGVRVKAGQHVKAGQAVGAEGTTGNVTGRHLHWELHRGRAWQDTNINGLFRDQGGNLPPGLSMVLNNTGKDEWVFNDRQLRTLDAAVSRPGPQLDLEALADVLDDRPLRLTINASDLRHELARVRST